ncbi:hypothetical protein T11_4850 [Trichinella zimbabwensis]|uniref:Uncharacterized protein n=1 Tax=Trichinella zimbabwensis TaxID=268475 RepID=A0A0V1H408_9BILA|nr:hypothetical protein T11_4850 [Trichinella zimbabwensis]
MEVRILILLLITLSCYVRTKIIVFCVIRMLVVIVKFREYWANRTSCRLEQKQFSKIRFLNK